MFSGLQTLLLILAFAFATLAHPHWGPGSRNPGNYERGRGRFPGAYYPGRAGVPIVIIVEQRPASTSSTTAAPTVAVNATTPAPVSTPAVSPA
jgi:hypothetical protein